MSNSFYQGTADGSTYTFAIPFTYLERSDVVVQLNGVTLVEGPDYSFPSTGTLQFVRTPIAGATVTIMRQTSPDSSLVTFNNGAVLTAGDLNTAALQSFYRTQEIQDQLNTYIGAGVARYSIDGVNPGVDPASLLQAAADAALQTSLASTLLGALSDIASNASSILDQTNRVDTLQSTLDSLTSGVPGGIGTYLTNETNSRIAGDQALQDTLNIMGAVSGSGDTFVLESANVYVDGVTSMADKFAGLVTSIAGNTAAITSEATSRASGDSANASSITALTTTVAGHTASIASQLTSINGLEAQYTVRLDVNGNVAGFGLASGAGGTSEFTVVADKFSIIDNSGGTPVVPFTVTGGVVYMQNVVIGNALIQDMSIAKLTQGNLTEDMSLGTGKIVWDNGAYMKVLGNGFGTSSQFVSWFGPHKASYDLCDETSAISFEKVDGSAYFAGALLSGVLSNSTQGTVLDDTNVADLGPYSSVGHTITVNWSYVFNSFDTFAGTSGGKTAYDAVTKQAPSAVLKLQRSIAGGSFTDVLTINISNGSHDEVSPEPADGAGGDYHQSMSGSGTYTDPDLSASNREYRLVIDSWTDVNATVSQNILSLHSTEAP